MILCSLQSTFIFVYSKCRCQKAIMGGHGWRSRHSFRYSAKQHLQMRAGTHGTKLQLQNWNWNCKQSSLHKGAVFTLGTQSTTNITIISSPPPPQTQPQPSPPVHSWCTSSPPAILEWQCNESWLINYVALALTHTVGFTYLHKNAGQKLSHHVLLYVFHIFAKDIRMASGTYCIDCLPGSKQVMM